MWQQRWGSMAIDRCLEFMIGRGRCGTNGACLHVRPGERGPVARSRVAVQHKARCRGRRESTFPSTNELAAICDRSTTRGRPQPSMGSDSRRSDRAWRRSSSARSPADAKSAIGGSSTYASGAGARGARRRRGHGKSSDTEQELERWTAPHRVTV
jgi:hypothetical protein